MGDLARPIDAGPLNIIGIDKGAGDETTVAVIKAHKGGFMEVIDVKYGEEAAAILRALEAEGNHADTR